MKKTIIKIFVNLLLLIILAIIGFIAYIIISCKKDIENMTLGKKISSDDDSILQIDSTYKELPAGLIDAILVSENDTEFFQRKTSILKSIFDKDYINITMIVTKNNLTLTNSSDFIRKIKIAYISRHFIEKKYTKQQILDFYINNNYLSGNGEKHAYSFAAASQIYFEKSLSDLSLPEYILLPILVKYPTRNNLYNYTENATNSRNKLLDKMLEKNYLTINEVNEVKNTNIKSLIKGEYTYKATNIEEFIGLLNDTDRKTKEKDTYKVSYNNIVFIAKKQNNSEKYTNAYHPYKYEILYKEKQLDIPNIENEEYENSKFYLVKDNNKNNAYVLISTISPAAVHASYSMIIFDESGNILLSKKIKTSKEIEVTNNIINYTYETKLGESTTINNALDNAKSKEEFCKYLKDNYTDDNYIISGNETYEYIDGKINQKEKIEKSIKYYKEHAECK